MEDVDFDDEAGEEADAEAWETEDDEGVEDGMEPQDDSEVTFSLHSGKWRARAAAAGVPRGSRSCPGCPQSTGGWTLWAVTRFHSQPLAAAARPELGTQPVLLFPTREEPFPTGVGRELSSLTSRPDPALRGSTGNLGWGASGVPALQLLFTPL